MKVDAAHRDGDDLAARRPERLSGGVEVGVLPRPGEQTRAKLELADPQHVFGHSTPSYEVNDFDPVAFFELGASILRPWNDFFVALDGDQSVREPERRKQLLDGRARFDLSFFTVDHETHRPGA